MKLSDYGIGLTVHNHSDMEERGANIFQPISEVYRIDPSSENYILGPSDTYILCSIHGKPFVSLLLSPEAVEYSFVNTTITIPQFKIKPTTTIYDALIFLSKKSRTVSGVINKKVKERKEILKAFFEAEISKNKNEGLISFEIQRSTYPCEFTPTTAPQTDMSTSIYRGVDMFSNWSIFYKGVKFASIVVMRDTFTCYSGINHGIITSLKKSFPTCGDILRAIYDNSFKFNYDIHSSIHDLETCKDTFHNMKKRLNAIGV